jgi:hypothetical protein
MASAPRAPPSLRADLRSASMPPRAAPACRAPAAPAASAAAASATAAPPPGFEDAAARDFALAIVGDLHLPRDPAAMGEFRAARAQLAAAAAAASAAAPRLVQLGDLGSYEADWPGSAGCFAAARAYLDGFGIPRALILGNHDLEDAATATDAENLAAWRAAFGQRHFWAARLGPATLVGLSTVNFRENPHSVHEVHIDAEQIAFLEEQVAAAGAEGRPVVVFSHAPILGSGLRAVQAVHVKNRCAWANHSRPSARVFSELVARAPHVKLWFSGHFHLSQSYPDSISLVGGTAFVLTGVIGGGSTRDGQRQSRLLRGDADGYELYTLDHDTGATRLDLRGGWAPGAAPEYLVPPEELLCDPEAGWLCSEVVCGISGPASELGGGGGAAAAPPAWLNSGGGHMLHLTEAGMVVEYDATAMAPVGVAVLTAPPGAVMRLVDAGGAPVDAVRGGGDDAAALEVVDLFGEVAARVERSAEGRFYRVFQPNKWAARKKSGEPYQSQGGPAYAAAP